MDRVIDIGHLIGPASGVSTSPGHLEVLALEVSLDERPGDGAWPETLDGVGEAVLDLWTSEDRREARAPARSRL